MIYIDARQGLSGDMLLAAMLGLLDPRVRDDAVAGISGAARGLGLGFRISSLDDGGEKGFGLSYPGSKDESHGRTYDDSYFLLEKINRDLNCRSDVSLRILDEIFSAEAQAHELPVKDVHLHEVGRPVALLNICGIGLAAVRLQEAGAGDMICSTIVTGKGITVVSHGAVRVPAPAVRVLLKGLKHEPGSDPGERATPTGLAAIKVLARTQSDIVPETYSRASVGFGTKRFGGRLGRTVLYWA
ncbi:MAG TPA: nickel insertion protein [Thermoplasmata archaeon]|jgi:uncharacterized protein (DUF111 family)